MTNLNLVFSQGNDKINNDWGLIDSIFRKLDTENELKKHCRIEYEESQIDFDLWDNNYSLIFSEIDRSRVIELIDYYFKYCSICDSVSIHKLMNERDSFLTGNLYSIDLYYKIVEKQNFDIYALISSKDRYILFYMRSDKK